MDCNCIFYECYVMLFVFYVIVDFRWSHVAIMLLLEEYRLRESSMSSGKMSHKKAWDEIAAIMNTKGYNVSGRQCMTRINTMKRTYKTIKDHNAKSGNNTRTWKYYEVSITLVNFYFIQFFHSYTLTTRNTILTV